MKKLLHSTILLLFLLTFTALVSCAGGFGADSDSAEDLAEPIFGSDSLVN